MNMLYSKIYFMDLFFMVLKVDMIDQTFLLPTDLRTMILDNHIVFFIERFVNCIDLSDIDSPVRGECWSKGLSCYCITLYYSFGYYLWYS